MGTGPAPLVFVKFVAAGNDFVLVDGDRHLVPPDLAGFGSWVCRPQIGVGADGLVVVRRSAPDRIDVTVVNPDGSTAKMCGNGVRCAAHYALHAGMRAPLRVVLGRHKLVARPAAGAVEVTSPRPGPVHGPTQLAGLDFYTVDTGTEYAVALVPDLEAVDVAGLGRWVRYHDRFAPYGTSVSFAQVVDGALAVRTYERGNEAETLSCGSGAVACAMVARHLGAIPDGPIAIRTRSGRPLGVRLGGAPPPFDGVTLTGPAEVVFTGALRWPQAGHGGPDGRHGPGSGSAGG